MLRLVEPYIICAIEGIRSTKRSRAGSISTVQVLPGPSSTASQNGRGWNLGDVDRDQCDVRTILSKVGQVVYTYILFLLSGC